MFKLFKIIALSSLLIVGSAISSYGFLLPPGPFTPTADAPTDVAGTTQNVAAAAQGVAAQLQTYANNATAAVKAAKKEYMSKFTGFMNGLFQKKEKKDMPGAKTIEETKIADIYDADSVKQALYELFLAYPVDCNKGADEYEQCQAYEAKAQEFYEDTVIEIYTSSRKLEEELETLTAEVDKLSTTFAGGSTGADGAESGDDENGAWKNAFNAYETMDSILKITQEALAMKLQYEAAILLHNQITPAAYVSKSEREAKEKAAQEQTSFNLTQEPVKLASSGVISRRETLMFGQLGFITQADFNLQSSQASANTATQEDDEEYVYNPSLYGNVTFGEANKPNIDSPFAGNEEKMQELDKIEPIYEKAQSALDVHNLMQALDSYQEIFKSYQQYQKLHQKAIDAVNSSDQCVMQYLGRYYSTPQTVWKGTMPDAAVNDYDARQGLSGWAIKAFELAKSEESTPMEPEDMGTIEIDTDVDIDDANGFQSIQKELESKGNNGLTDASKTEEIEQSTRESQMISFNIGAEAAQLLVEDQHKTTPQWGTPTKKFPIWNDQISFYNQYIGGKYGNIKDYLQQYDVTSIIVEIAYPLNDILTEDADERANNRAGLDSLSARLAQEDAASDPASVLESLEKNKDELLQKALNSKQSRLQSLESRKKSLQDKLDKASGLLADYSEQLNTAQQNKLKAQAGVDTQGKILQDQEDRQGDIEDNITKQNSVEYADETYEVTPETTKEVHSTEYQENTEQRMLFDTDEAISEYKDKMNKLNYQAKQQQVFEKQKLQPNNITSNPDGSVSLYPEDDTTLEAPAANEKKTLFRRRPFSENGDFAPGNGSKYALSRTLYFGAQYNTFDYAQEKAKLDAELDSKAETTTEYTTLDTTDKVDEETQEAQTADYTASTEKESEVLNLEDTEGMSLAKEEINQYQAEVEQNTELAASLKTQVDSKDQEVANLKKQLEQVEEQIAAEEQNYISQVQQIEQAYNQKLDEAKKYIEEKRKAKETLDLVAYYQNKIGLPVAGANGIIPPFSLLRILQTASGLTSDTKSYAVQLVDDTQNAIMNLGEDVYIGAYGDEIVKLHQDLMTKLKDLPVEGLQNFSSAVGAYAKTASIIKPLTSMFQKMLIEQACVKDACMQADDDYFVGSYGKARDFMAPKNSLQEYLPPLREFVHFDDVDHDNVAKTSDGGVSKEGLLNSGGKFPEIWKLILKNKAFVDKDIDIKTLLSEGNEAANFMRGGRYPCILDNYIIDLTNTDGTFSVYSTKVSDEWENWRQLPQCQEISLEGASGLLAQLKRYVTIKDKAEDVTASAQVFISQEIGNTGSNSELGTLLKATDSGLYYNNAPEKVFARLEKMAEEKQEGSSYTENMQDIVYEKTMLDHNQIGNFLTFVEQEISYRQALEEMKLSVDEAKAELFEKFEEIGFVPSADYDLAKQEDYDLTKETLNRYKNSLINEATEQLDTVNVMDNEVVQERVDKIKNIFTALRKDKEAYISLSDTTDSGSELDERIKTEEVNHQVTSEYKKKADEEFEKQLNSFPIPFCAAY